MIEDIRNASNILKSALAQYLDASVALRRKYDSGYAPDTYIGPVLDELEQISTYELTMNQCKRTLSKLRNSRSTLVPANALPPELLSRIFILTTPTDCSTPWDGDYSACPDQSSRTPESLLYVCSYWRSIALGSQVLWTHIDLTPFTSSTLDLVSAGRRFAARSGESPLYVHANLVKYVDSPRPDEAFFSFCELVAKRAKSIELDYAHRLGSKRIAIIEKLIANCTPGKLSRLAMYMVGFLDERGPIGFITANNSLGGPSERRLPLDVSHDHLEKVFSGVTALTLDGIYPWWTSQAYHGLVKLYISDSTGFLVPVSRLASILRTSPQLRFFYIGNPIVEDTQPDPVCLNDLEVLEVEVNKSQYNAVLRLILPGPKSLKFSVWMYDVNLTPGTLTKGEYKKIFSRSNVTQFEASCLSDGPNATLDLRELLSISPTIKVLSLDGFDLELPSNNGTSAEPPSGYQLAELRLATSTIDPNVFQWVINLCPTLKIRIEEPTCSVQYKGKDYNNMERWKEVLIEMYPAVQFVEDASLPDDGWD